METVLNKGYLEFDNVTFAYPGETESPVLHNISFKAKPGETIAFIGSTGSGKSSLVQLIQFFMTGIFLTITDIFTDGSCKEQGFLWNKANLTTQSLQIIVTDIHTINKNASKCRSEEHTSRKDNSAWKLYSIKDIWSLTM